MAMRDEPVFDDDNPEWTKEDFARARPASEVIGRKAADALVRPRGRPALDPSQRKQAVSIRLSADVLAALRSTGPGWQSRVDQMLRERLKPS